MNAAPLVASCAFILDVAHILRVRRHSISARLCRHEQTQPEYHNTRGAGIAPEQRPRCGKYQVMNKAGRQKKNSGHVLGSARIEWKCSYCGHLKLEERTANTGSGD